MKEFNTTGTCFPEDHYMVDISERIAIIRSLVDKGKYFCINRGRQYGKTTTLEAIKRSLSDRYIVLSSSFEGYSDDAFATIDTLAYRFLKILNNKMILQPKQYSESIRQLVVGAVKDNDGKITFDDFSFLINKICLSSDKPIVLLIDEVDQAGNHDSFIKFLALLRNMYLIRRDAPTFQSVILAGVYDIKNLKLKIRDEKEHQYNSPWNIAVPFNVDMSLHADGIAGMLREYQNEHEVSFDENLVANEIYDYTSGYPFLVSRLCQIIDNEQYGWDKEGIVKAVHDILGEKNTLFQDLVKKITDFPKLKQLLKVILFSGKKMPFSSLEQSMELAEMFCFIRNDRGAVRISNRIFETCLYNLFTTESAMESIYTEGSIDKNQFIVNNMLNMKHIIERFVVHYNDIYGSNGDKFKEADGRKLFLLYLRPIINGVGNYYIEAETRDETRTDIVVDYLGNQYVIELKIWRGNSYNERGEQQLAEYLNYFHLETGYLVSYCFNRKKEPEMKTVNVGGRTVYEAVV